MQSSLTGRIGGVNGSSLGWTSSMIALVARFAIIRVIETLAFIYNIYVHQIYVKAVFVNGTLDE